MRLQLDATSSMHKAEVEVLVEVLSEKSNMAVIRTITRRFPGIVVQGDSLSVMYRQAARVAVGLRSIHDSELRGEAVLLAQSLSARLRHYEAALGDHGIELPYSPIDWAGEPDWDSCFD